MQISIMKERKMVFEIWAAKEFEITWKSEKIFLRKQLMVDLVDEGISDKKEV